jgi:hypothetical protein
MFSLSYKIQSKSESNVFGTCLGILFDSEQKAWSYLDLVEKDNYILEANLKELENYKPSKRVVIATTRSWE